MYHKPMMAKWKMYYLVFIGLIVSTFFPCKAFAQSADNYTIFSRNYLNNIVEDTIFSSSEAITSLTVSAAKGEKEPAQFVVQSPVELKDVQVRVSDLIKGAEKIPKENIDIRIVRVMTKRKLYTLDPSNVNNLERVPEILDHNKPVTFIGNKQWWLVVKVPENISAGLYQGTIMIVPANAQAKALSFSVKVYPFSLEPPPANKTPGIFYATQCTFQYQGQTVSTCSTTEAIVNHVRKDLEVIKDAGLKGIVVSDAPMYRWTNGQMNIYYNSLIRIMDLLASLGFQEKIPYYGISRVPTLINEANPELTQEEKDAIYVRTVQEIEQLRASRNWPEFLYYPVDEPGYMPGNTGYDLLAKYHGLIIQVNPNLMIFVTNSQNHMRGDYLTRVLPHVDVPVIGRCTETGHYADVLNFCASRSAGKECWQYQNMNRTGDGVEQSRLSFGYFFYRSPFTHQYPWTFEYINGDPFDDLDTGISDWTYVYPDPDNNWDPNLPAIKLEGVREGIDDLRYIATLVKAISRAPANLATTKAEASRFLQTIKDNSFFDSPIKGSSTDKQLYDNLRLAIADYIVALSSAPTPTPTPPAVNCPNGELGNLNCDALGLINTFDLQYLLDSWTLTGPAPASRTGFWSPDLVPDNKVNNLDLQKVLTNWKIR